MTSCWLRLTQPANVTRSRCHDRSPLMSTILSAGWPLATSVLHKAYVRLNQWTLRVRLCLGLILLPFWFHSKAHFRGGNRHSKCETEYKRLFLRIIMQRRGGDSNPRYGYPHTGFRNQPLQPLGHLSDSSRRLGTCGVFAAVLLSLASETLPSSLVGLCLSSAMRRFASEAKAVPGIFVPNPFRCKPVSVLVIWRPCAYHRRANLS